MNRLDTIKQKAKLIIGTEIQFLLADTVYTGTIKEMVIRVGEDLSPTISYKVSSNTLLELVVINQDQII